LNTKNDLFASFQKQKMIHLLQVKNKRWCIWFSSKTKDNTFTSVLNTKNDLFASFQIQKMIHLI
jgi:hypothetical protein